MVASELNILVVNYSLLELCLENVEANSCYITLSWMCGWLVKTKIVH